MRVHNWKRDLLSKWEKVWKAYSEFKEKPTVKHIVKLVVRFLKLIAELILKVVLKKWIEHFFG